MSNRSRSGHSHRFHPPPSAYGRQTPVAPLARTLTISALSAEERAALQAEAPGGLEPAPAFEDAIGEPFDLGQINPRFAGMLVQYNHTLDMSIQEVIEVIRDPRASEVKRSAAAKAFLKKVLAKWNLTKRRLIGTESVVEFLPQPPAGVDALPIDQDLIIALIQGYNQEIAPSPN